MTNISNTPRVDVSAWESQEIAEHLSTAESRHVDVKWPTATEPYIPSKYGELFGNMHEAYDFPSYVHIAIIVIGLVITCFGLAMLVRGG